MRRFPDATSGAPKLQDSPTAPPQPPPRVPVGRSGEISNLLVPFEFAKVLGNLLHRRGNTDEPILRNVETLLQSEPPPHFTRRFGADRRPAPRLSPLRGPNGSVAPPTDRVFSC